MDQPQVGGAAEMPSDPLATHERSSPQVVREQVAHFASMAELQRLLDAVPCFLVILNSHRQAVFANRTLLSLLQLPTADTIFGLRPGEILDCEHAGECQFGCGTSESCVVCGAASAIAGCEGQNRAVRDCRIIQKRSGKALDLRVSTTPIEVNGQHFTIMALSDIGHEKRRSALERIFFHDVLNTAGAIVGHAQLLERVAAADVPEITATITRLANTLVEEIRAQRDLLAAESNDLVVSYQSVNARALVRDVAEAYGQHSASQERAIVVDAGACDITFISDRHLLTRVLSNAVKNALEAASRGQVVTLACRADAEGVEFTVHNPGFIPREIQLQLFQRSFSTKGAGRGLGTYSIKLLTERYLGGAVSYSTSPAEGTMFRLRYPRSPGPGSA